MAPFFFQENGKILRKLPDRKRLCPSFRFSVSSGIHRQYSAATGKKADLMLEIPAVLPVSMQKNQRLPASLLDIMQMNIMHIDRSFSEPLLKQHSCPFHPLHYRNIKRTSDFASSTSDTAVSYTHLDVYKRQK